MHVNYGQRATRRTPVLRVLLIPFSHDNFNQQKRFQFMCHFPQSSASNTLQITHQEKWLNLHSLCIIELATPKFSFVMTKNFKKKTFPLEAAPALSLSDVGLIFYGVTKRHPTDKSLKSFPATFYQTFPISICVIECASCYIIRTIYQAPKLCSNICGTAHTHTNTNRKVAHAPVV